MLEKQKVMIKFLIITQPRSGSSFLTSCLNSHPQIYCPRGSLFTNPDSLEKLIENYDVVKQTLMNTEFENFLH